MRQAIVILIFLASPLGAQTVLESHFGNPAQKSGNCFVREYGAAHLAKHPDQLVKQIAVQISMLSPDGPNPELRVSLAMRGDPYYYSALAYCKTKGNALACLMEGDAGGFSLTGDKGGVLRLTVAKNGMGFEGDRFVEISGTRGDDRVFLIPNVSGDFCN